MKSPWKRTTDATGIKDEAIYGVDIFMVREAIEGLPRSEGYNVAQEGDG